MTFLKFLFEKINSSKRKGKSFNFTPAWRAGQGTVQELVLLHKLNTTQVEVQDKEDQDLQIKTEVKNLKFSLIFFE